jgi:PAS domain S-box-containing protein
VLVALVAATLLGAATALHQSQDRAGEAARDRAERGAVALERVFASTAVSLDGVRGFLTVRAGATEAEFRTYAAHLLREPALSGVTFSASVPAAQRAAYERRAGRPILEPALLGLRPARRRARYYPVTFAISRVAGARRTLGVDIGTDAVRRAALEAARDSGHARASAPVSLIATRKLGVIVFQPVFARGRPLRTVAERRAALVGFATGGFQTDRLGAQVLAQMPAGTRLQIFDGPTQVFGPAGVLDGGREHALSLAGRSWRVVASGPGVAWGFPGAVLIAGLLASALVALLIRQSLRRERYALALVDERLGEQRAVEAALREREAQLAEAQRIASVGSWEWDVRDDAIRWSDELCRLFGVSPEGFSPSYEEYLARLHPADRGRVGEIIGRAMEDGEPFSFHHRLIRPGGAVGILHSRGRVERDGDGRIVRMLGTAQDVTEARRAEEELRRQRDYAAGLVNAMQDGLFVLSPTGEVIEASPSFCALTGFSREELVGTRGRYPYWPEGTDGRLARAFARLASDGSGEWDLEFRHRDGRPIPVLLSAFVLRDADGGVIGYPATVKDVTERRAVQQLKDEFIALASHELRTPLSSVLGYLEIVLEEGGQLGTLNEQQRRFLGVAERNAQKLVRLVGDLLVVGRADAGRLALERTEVDLAAIARECGESARRGAEERGIALHVGADTALHCAADHARIVQVIDNLLSNALKFTPPGGRVELSAGVHGDEALIQVTDTGIGIAPAEQARLFERFFRTSAATREAIPGTGLGLAISRMIVGAHGGRIWFESEEGRGSTFCVSLPLAAARASSGSPAATSASA